MSTIKAIQTRWHNRLFRSRLEARWAVFFESCGFRWEYEPEGYWVSEKPYLPDFYLPHENFFVDIKPRSFSEKQEDDREVVRMTIIQSLWNVTTPDSPLWVVVGNPCLGEYEVHRHAEHGYGKEAHKHADPPILFARCRRDACAGMSYVSVDGTEWGDLHMDCPSEKQPILESLDAAYATAMEARFEHGEQP